jgi:teichuronic acid biosynthesis glycosyltransferase TuaC
MVDPNSPISILTATTLFPNFIQPSHGIFVETRLRRLLAGGGVQAHVIAPVPWMPPGLHYPERGKLREIPDAERRNNIEIEHPRYVVIPKVGMNITPYTLYLAMRRRVARLLAAGLKIDLIDAHYFYPDGVAATWLGQALNIPVVITARGTDINLIPNFRYPRRLILEGAQNASALITVCQALKDRLVELSVPPSKITVLRNGVDLERFKMQNRGAVRSKWAVNGFVLASVGLLIERKGHDLVIEAIKDVPHATLLIVGAGPERQHLENLSIRLGVNNRVRFLGALDQSSLCEIYNCADALILASSREGWANVLLESMACGTPVIGSAVWGTPEVIARPEAGILLKSRDARSIVAAIAQLRGALPDRLSTRKYAEQFDWQATTNGQIELFQSMIRQHRIGQ